MAVTIKQLSEYLGISPSAVSKALNGYGDISQETRDKVLRVAYEWGYRPSAIARGLKTGRTHNLGVVFSEYSGSGFTHSYFSPVLENFKAEAERRGYDITFISPTLRIGGEEPLTYLQHSHYRNVDGVCIVCCEFTEDQVLQLANSTLPLVTVDHAFPGHACVASQNRQGMKTLTEHVIALGHRDIALVYGSPAAATEQRMESFLSVMAAHGLPVPPHYLVESLYHNPRAVRKALKGLLELPDRPSCILLPDDFASLGGIEAIMERGLSIPEDVSIAGFDGVPILQMLRPRLTTIAQDTARIGQEAARLLIEQIESPQTAFKGTVEIPTRLLAGETVAPYPRKQIFPGTAAKSGKE